MKSSYQNRLQLIKNTDPSHIYYNISIYNDTNDFLNAEFLETRTEPILENPQDYYLSIVRFSFTAANTVPIFLFPDPSIWSITLSYNNNDYQTFLIYTGNGDEQLPQPVYSYQHMTNMINTAFQTAFTNLKNANPAIISNVAPYYELNIAEHKLDLHVQKSYIADGIEIYANALLFEKFLTPHYALYNGQNQPNGKDYQIFLENFGYNCLTNRDNLCIYPGLTGANPPNAWNSETSYDMNDIVEYGGEYFQSLTGPNVCVAPIPEGCTGADGICFCDYWRTYNNFESLIIKQEFSPFPNWSDVRNFIFTSSTLPIINEYIAERGSDGSNKFFPIVTDLIPVINTGFDIRSQRVIYIPESEYRLISLIGATPLKTFDIQLFWESIEGMRFPVRIPRRQVLTVKFLFRKKDFNGPFIK